MIKNRIVKLDKDSQERIDAKNTIKYTLLLDYQVPEYDDDRFINNIFSKCNECCFGLFYDKIFYYLTYGGKCAFFGSLSNPLKKEDPIPYELQIDTIPDFKTFTNGYISYIKKSTYDKDENSYQLNFNNLILQHCVISCYHAVITELDGNGQVSDYSIVNGNHISTPKNYTKASNNTEKSRLASDFKKKSNNHLKAMPFFENIAHNQLFSEVWFQVCCVNKSRFCNLFDTEEKDNLNLKSIIDNITFISDKLLVVENINTMEVIHYNYIVERIFNFHMLISIINTIFSTHNNNNNNYYKLDQNDLISTISKITSLPNVFSRQIFWLYAFFHVNKNINSFYDFWFKNDPDNSDTFAVSTRRIKRSFDLYRWKDQFHLFIKYLSEFIIPIYEWCFTCMMFDSLEKEFPNMSHEEHLKKSAKLLKKFALKNHQILINPYPAVSKNKANSNSNIYNAVNKIEKIIYPSTLSENAIMTLINNFLSANKNIDLNLSPNINPEYFKANPRNLRHTSTDKIREFYIDLLRYNYWKPDI